jgi:hypothetical protein
MVLDALEDGWSGPPFDPFELAERAGVETVPREDLEDARLVSAPGQQPRLEFNPHRRPERVRFSVAHELGHLLFSDHAAQTRYRTESHTEHARLDDWQLEVLCNVAAAEILMPAGAFPAAYADDLSLPHLLDLRAHFGVSTEALLRRVVKLTERAVCLFAATRLPDGGFRIDYTVPSHAFEHRLPAGQTIGSHTVLAHCTAVGFSVDDTEDWPGIDGAVRVQAVGIPPYPGHRFPRVVGLLQREVEADRRVQGIRIVRGDATRPMREGPTMIAHIVNDTARRWGGMASRALSAGGYAPPVTTTPLGPAMPTVVSSGRFISPKPSLISGLRAWSPRRATARAVGHACACLRCVTASRFSPVKPRLATPPSTCLPSAPAKGAPHGRECAT